MLGDSLYNKESKDINNKLSNFNNKCLINEICNDLLYLIIEYSSLDDLIFSHRFINRQFYNLVDYDNKNDNYQALHLWSNIISYSLRNNCIIKILFDNINKNKNPHQITEFYINDNDGHRMFCQCITGLQYIKDEIKNNCKFKFADEIYQFGKYNFDQHHPWICNPQKYGFKDECHVYKSCLSMRYHKTKCFMEPATFDPLSADYKYYIRKKKTEIREAITFLSELLFSQQTTKKYLMIIYDSRSVYLFIYILSLMINNVKYYGGYDKCLNLIEYMMNISLWHNDQFTKLLQGRWGRFTRFGTMCMLSYRTKWFSLMIDILDIALEKMIKSKNKIYIKPKRNICHMAYW